MSTSILLQNPTFRANDVNVATWGDTKHGPHILHKCHTYKPSARKAIIDLELTTKMAIF